MKKPVKIEYKTTRIYHRREVRNDYLKEYRVVRRWMQNKYDLKIEELEILLYLYSEKLFTFYDFRKMCVSLGIGIRKFKVLKEKEWIHLWQDKHRGQFRQYELTAKGRKAIGSMYKKLNGEEPLPLQHFPAAYCNDTKSKKLVKDIQLFNERFEAKRVYKRTDY